MERLNAKKDLIAMMVIFIFAIVLYVVLIPNYIPQRGSVSGDIVFTSRTFPKILGILMGTISLFGLVKNGYILLKTKTSVKESVKEQISLSEKLNRVRPFIVFLIIVLYAVLFTKIGMIFSSVICLPLLLVGYGEKMPLHYIEVAAFCSIMYAVFRFVLHIPLP